MSRTIPSPSQLAPWSTLILKEGRTLSYAEYGDPQGQPLLLFHGIPGSRLDFELWAEELAVRRLRGIAVDRPGMGRSGHHPHRTILGWAQDVRELADHLGLAKFTVLGASGGGPHALACGYALPERINQVVLVASGVPIETPNFMRGMSLGNRVGFWSSRYFPALLRPISQLQHWLLRRYPHKVIESFSNAVGPEDAAQFTEVDGDVLINMILEAFAGGTEGVVRETELHARPWDFKPEDVCVPVTIWHGRQDRLVPVAGTIHLAGRLPDAKMHLLSDHGHLLDFYPGTLAAILDDGEITSMQPI